MDKYINESKFFKQDYTRYQYFVNSLVQQKVPTGIKDKGYFIKLARSTKVYSIVTYL